MSVVVRRRVCSPAIDTRADGSVWIRRPGRRWLMQTLRPSSKGRLDIVVVAVWGVRIDACAVPTAMRLYAYNFGSDTSESGERFCDLKKLTTHSGVAHAGVPTERPARLASSRHPGLTLVLIGRNTVTFPVIDLRHHRRRVLLDRGADCLRIIPMVHRMPHLLRGHGVAGMWTVSCICSRDCSMHLGHRIRAFVRPPRVWLPARLYMGSPFTTISTDDSRWGALPLTIAQRRLHVNIMSMGGLPMHVGYSVRPTVRVGTRVRRDDASGAGRTLCVLVDARSNLGSDVRVDVGFVAGRDVRSDLRLYAG